jgi:aspartate/methionine/tyrosine aminotransferase
MRRQGWAQRTRDIQAFHVMSVLARAKTLEAQGHDVIHMEIGEPDFSTPAPIVRAGQAALASGQTGYTPALGLPALREAIAGLYAQRYGVDLDLVVLRRCY